MAFLYQGIRNISFSERFTYAVNGWPQYVIGVDSQADLKSMFSNFL